MPFLVKIVVARHVVVVIAMTHILTRMIIVVTCIVPRMAATPVSVAVSVVAITIVTVVTTIPVAIMAAIPITVRIADIDMQRPGSKMDALSNCFIRLNLPPADDQHRRPQ